MGSNLKWQAEKIAAGWVAPHWRTMMESNLPSGVGTRSFEELVRKTVLVIEMAEALAPFAAYPDERTESWRDDAPVFGFTLGNVRRAKAALAKARSAGLVP